MINYKNGKLTKIEFIFLHFNLYTYTSVYFDYFSKMHITFFMTHEEKLASQEMRKKRNEEKKQPVGSTVYLLAQNVLVFPSTINYVAELAIAEEHRQKEAAKLQAQRDKEEAFEKLHAAIPLTPGECAYRYIYHLELLSNAHLRIHMIYYPYS